MMLYRTMLGDVIRTERLDRGLTMRQVCAEANMSIGYLSEVERGIKEASSEVLGSIAAAMGLAVWELVGKVSDQMKHYAKAA